MATMQKLDQLLDQFISAGVPGCGLAVSYKGEIVYTGYRGKADLEQGTEIDEQTVYRIASCTKIVTAVAVMKLYEEGKLLLNDPVEEYLPFFHNIPYQTCDGSGEVVRHPTTGPLTIKHLLTMTSGIPYAGRGSVTANDYREKLGNIYQLTAMDLAQKISEIPLEFDPGTHWKYGLGYDVLGAIVEAITGTKFGTYIQEEVLTPLGMTHTAFLCTQEMEKRRARTYQRTENGYIDTTREANITPTNGGKLESGGGGLLSTLGDLVQLAGMLAQGGSWKGERLLSRNTIDLMRLNHLRGQAMEDFRRMSEQSYPWYKGYGWGLAGRTLIDCQEAGSNGSVGEFGWCGAVGPYILADPEQELGIAYVHQMSPVIGGMQDYCHPRVRNTVYALLDK